MGDVFCSSIFCSRLKALRISRRLSQEEVAIKIGVSLQEYSNFESYYQDHQKKCITTLIKVADYFSVSTDYLLGCVDNPFLLTTDEKEHLGAVLKRYRERKKRFVREKNREGIHV